MSDEELQQQAEHGRSGSSADERAYRMVFQALNRPPSYRLPSNFADRVIQRMEAPARSSAREMIWLYVGLVAFVVAGILTAVLIGFRINAGAFRFVAGYPGLFIFGAAFILSLQWIDKHFVRKPSL